MTEHGGDCYDRTARLAKHVREEGPNGVEVGEGICAEGSDSLLAKLEMYVVLATYCSTSSAVESRIDLALTMPALLIRIVGGPSCAPLASRHTL